MGHTKDVLSVAFSADNRQIVSGSRDHTIKLWNTLGVCKYTIQVQFHRPDYVLLRGVAWFCCTIFFRMTVTVIGLAVCDSLQMLKIL